MANIAQAGSGGEGDASLKHSQDERDKVLLDLTRQRATLEATQKDVRERKAEVERLRQMQESLKAEMAKQQAEVDRWKAEAEKNRAAAAQAQAALATAVSSLSSANNTAGGEENRLRPNAANNKFGSSRGKKEREEALAQILPMLAPPAEALAVSKEADPNQPLVRKIGFW
jgi:chromosome segregation ATPase